MLIAQVRLASKDSAYITCGPPWEIHDSFQCSNTQLACLQ